MLDGQHGSSKPIIEEKESTNHKQIRDMGTSKYWHELPQEEIDKILKSGITVSEAVEKYKQPDWCNYPGAVTGMVGCWSLTDNKPGGLRTTISKDYCKSCEFFITT